MSGRAASTLDDVSKAIIEQLQQDGRRPYAAIGKAVGLSEAAVRQRVARLQESGVMQVVAVTDPIQVGFSRAAMVGIRVDGDVEAVAEQVESLPEVEYLGVCAGSFDLLAEVPAEVVVLNHAMGLYELAAIHLSSTPPKLPEAALAIDAVACLVEGLGDRLGPDAATLRDALANIQMAFVQVRQTLGA